MVDSCFSLVRWCCVLIGAVGAVSPIESWAVFETVIEIDDPADPAPTAIGDNTQLNLSGSGVLGDFEVGKTDGTGVNAELNVFGGQVSALFLNVNAGGTMNVSGGLVSSLLGIAVETGAAVNYSGGVIDTFSFNAAPGSETTLIGGDFLVGPDQVPGLDAVGSEVTVDASLAGSIGGVLADGRPFFMPPGNYQEGATITLRATSLPAPIGLEEIRASADDLPPWLRRGQKLVVDQGSVVSQDLLAGPGSEVTVLSGSQIDGTLTAIGAKVEVRGGDRFQLRARVGSEVSVSGGEIDLFSSISTGAQATVTAGRVIGILAEEGSQLAVSGGQFGRLEVVGDNLIAGIAANPGAEVHLIGTEFKIANQPIDGLLGPGDSVLLTGSALTGSLLGLLSDGETVRLSFDDRNPFDNFSSQAVLRLTLVPEPSTLLLMGAAILCRHRRQNCL